MALDRIRVLAALAVFYLHIGLNLHLPLSDYGEYAVTTFLMMAIVSAVAFSLPKRQDEWQPGRYLITRLGRLMPLYVFVNLVIYAISFAVPSRLGRPFSGGELLLSCLGVSQYVRARYLSTVFWFIPFIVQVYFLIAIGQRSIDRLRAWWCLPAAFALLWLEILGMRFVETADPITILRNWSPLFRPTELVLGAQGGLWLAGRLNNQEFAGRIGWYAALAGLLALGCRQPLGYAYTLPLYGGIVTVLIVGVTWLTTREPGAAARRFWRRLGRATYPFYLIHGVPILFLFHHFGRSPAVWVADLVGCALAALVLDAVFSPRRPPVTA